MKKYQLMFEPLPGGWKYGFPRALPEEAVMGKGADLWINPAFDIVDYVARFGFPADALHKWKVWPEVIPVGEWPEEVKDETAEKMGDLKFTTAGNYMKNAASHCLPEEEKFTQRQWDRVVGYGKVPEKYRKGDDDNYVYPGSDCQE